MELSAKYMLFNYVILMSTIGNYVQGKAIITHAPLSPLYVVRGGTARFIWDYTVDNRTEEFQLFSPAWNYHYANGTVVDIAQEHFLTNWKWKISSDACPKRLLNPTTRVSKESNATLVISNVTIADSGIYELVLLLRTAQPIKSKVHLLVTTWPKFSSQFKIHKIILEGRYLNINCSAVGIPTPNITWVSLKSQDKEIKSQGRGYAELFIQNITRNQSGTYQCQAINNPNESPVVNQTDVTVWYKPHITFLNWTIQETLNLFCLASGSPHPLIKWYSSSGMQIKSGVTEINGGIKVAIRIPNRNVGFSWRYQCNASNGVGWHVREINIIELPTKETLPTSTLTGTGDDIVVTSNLNNIKTTASTSYATTTTTRTTAVTSAKTPASTKKAAGKSGPEKSKYKINIVNIVLLSIFGVLLPIFIAASVIFIVRKRLQQRNKKDNRTSTEADDDKDTHQQNVLSETTNIAAYAEAASIPIYAQIDKSKKRASRREENLPIYTQVDKSKKTRLGQIIYAELEELRSPAETICTTLPSPYVATEYADIRNLPNQDSSRIKNPEPIYETLPDFYK